MVRIQWPVAPQADAIGTSRGHPSSEKGRSDPCAPRPVAPLARSVSGAHVRNGLHRLRGAGPLDGILPQGDSTRSEEPRTRTGKVRMWGRDLTRAIALGEHEPCISRWTRTDPDSAPVGRASAVGIHDLGPQATQPGPSADRPPGRSRSSLLRTYL